ncbi:MAG: hypothetical protein ABEH80_03505, partial [Halobaculum sp.]
MKALDDDWNVLLRDLRADGDDRCLYHLTSWNRPDATTTDLRDTSGDETEWRDDGPTPAPESLRGYGFWLDADLADDVDRDELSESERETVEQALETMLDAVAELYGVPRQYVYGLDSGGGAYIYGPPEFARAVADEFDDAARRRRAFKKFGKRLRQWGEGELWNRVTATVDGAEELLDPDSVQNPNRQSKAPLAIHKRHEVVCTPLRRRDPETGELVGSGVDYSVTRVSEVTDELVRETVTWAEELTRQTHNTPDTVVENLWPEESAECDGWRETLQQVVGEPDGTKTLDDVTATVDTDAEATGEPADELPAPLRELKQRIATLDARRAAEETIVESWTPDAGTSQGSRAFSPRWGNATSGTANIVDSDRWEDTGGYGGGGPVVMGAVAAALDSDADSVREWVDTHSDSHSMPKAAEVPEQSDVKGEAWWRGVAYLCDECEFDAEAFAGEVESLPDPR